MLDLEALSTLAQAIGGAIAIASTLVLAIWLWRETRRPKSLFTEQPDSTPTMFDRISDAAAFMLDRIGRWANGRKSDFGQ